MKSKNYFYRVKLSIKNIPGQEDLLDVQDFKRDYFFNSKDFARAKFEKGIDGIKSGSYKDKLPKSNKNSATLNIILCLVEDSNGTIKEYPLRDLENYYKENLKIEKFILDREFEKVQQEETKGFLRHKAPVTGSYFFIQKVKSKLNNIEKNTTTEFQEMKDAVNSHYYELDKLNRYSPEEGDYLNIQLFLVDQTGKDRIEQLMYCNGEKDGLTIALANELSDKQYLESATEKSPLIYNPMFGSKPSFWEVETRNPILESAPAGVFYRVTCEITESTHKVVSDITTTTFREDKEKSFFDLAKDAKKFYSSKLHEAQQHALIEEESDYFINVTLSLVKNSQVQDIYHPNTLKVCPDAETLEAEILSERRENINQIVSITEKSYRDYLKISDVLKTIEFLYYCVYEGPKFEQSKKMKRFIHHDLSKARNLALYFYNKLILERRHFEKNTDSKGDFITVVLHNSSWRDNSLYIKCTDMASLKQVQFGLKEEAKIFRRLGFSYDNN